MARPARTLPRWGKAATASVLVAAFAQFFANPAVAETDRERASARRLASEGAKAFSAGDYERAVDRLRRAEKLVHSPVHLLYIARAQRQRGKLVSAQENFLKITREELGPDDPRPWRDAQRNARRELAKLEPRVPLVTIEVMGKGADEATVVIDGDETPPELIGVAQPIDPGKHKVMVKAPGRRSKTVKFSIGEGDTKTLSLKLRKRKASEPEDDDDVSDDGDASSAVPYVAIGVGAAGLLAGGFFFFRWQSLTAEADDKCGGSTRCSDPALKREITDLDNQAATASALGFVGVGVGAAAITVGILMLNSGDKAEARRAPSVQPFVGWRSAGVSGRF